MNRLRNYTFPFWNTALLVTVIFAAFILPVLPPEYQLGLFRIAYSLIYVAAVFSLRKKSRYILFIFFASFIIEWVSAIFSMPVLNTIAKAANIIFFLLVVFTMIWMIAGAKRVNSEVILGSVIGYLLLGIIYSIFIAFIMQHDPSAFNVSISDGTNGQESVDTSVPMYFSFVTLATLGYGDILPLKPYTRSLMTWITISGQFYIAIIVALLVGKFSAQTGNESKKDQD